MPIPKTPNAQQQQQVQRTPLITDGYVCVCPRNKDSASSSSSSPCIRCCHFSIQEYHTQGPVAESNKSNAHRAISADFPPSPLFFLLSLYSHPSIPPFAIPPLSATQTLRGYQGHTRAQKSAKERAEREEEREEREKRRERERREREKRRERERRERERGDIAKMCIRSRRIMDARPSPHYTTQRPPPPPVAKKKRSSVLLRCGWSGGSGKTFKGLHTLYTQRPMLQHLRLGDFPAKLRISLLMFTQTHVPLF